MNTCKYEPCNNEAQGSSAYCSNSCRAQQSRRNNTGATSEAQHPTPDQIQAAAAVGRECTPMKPTRPPVNDKSEIKVCGSDDVPVRAIGVDFDEPSQPPCTAKQLISPCTACAKHDTCEYLHSQTTAVPGDAEYAGVA